jgi:phosphoribosylanthranilate isomerase
MNRLLKVCGARSRADVRLLASAGADLVGLWHAVPGGHADLGRARLTELATEAVQTGVEPVLVTFSADVDALAAILAETGIRWLQLHAYQPPAVVRALRAGVPPGTTIVKVLHLAAGTCLEQRFIPGYERAGTDVFLCDTVTADGRVGSTGQRLAGADVLTTAAGLSRPFLLAGGVRAEISGDHAAVGEHPLFLGIDVDTAARDERGQLCSPSVARIARGWHTVRHSEEIC